MRDDEETLGDAIVDSPAWDRRDPRFKQLRYIIKDEDGNPVGRAHPFSAHERNAFFVNKAGTFLDLSGLSGADTPADSRSFALIDFDRDGDHDIAMVNANTPSFQLYQTDVPNPGQFLRVRLVGGAGQAPGDGAEEGAFSNRDGIGARVTVTTASGRGLTRELHCGEGYGAQNSKELVFGLGKEQAIRSLQVRWPSGRVTSLQETMAAGSLVRVSEKE